MRHGCPAQRTHRLAVLLGVLLGAMNLFAGGRVLLGLWRPDHAVLLPLVLFNFAMGAVFIAAALRIRSDVRRGRTAAALVAALNAAVLLILLVRAASGALVPSDSLFAMALRTALWLVILMLTAHVLRRSNAAAAIQSTAGHAGSVG